MPNVVSLDPRTPVIVGVGSIQQREEDFANAREPLDLMADALERAAQDAGDRSLLRDADSIRAPRGFWNYLDPCRALAERFGATAVKTELAEIGVLQTTLFGTAARDIANGQCEIVLIAGGEARYRARRAKAQGQDENLTAQPKGTLPDRVWRPSEDILSACEIGAGLAMPVGAYAMIENALRAHEGQGLDPHRDDVAKLWSEFSRTAENNPDAWRPEFLKPEIIRNAGAHNAMLNFPYTKLHNSNWNVDQAAGLVLCSIAVAQRLGIPRERWIFPISVVDSNHMTLLSERREIHRSPGFAYAGDRALQHAGAEPKEVGHRELYSCFPSAVRIQQREIGFDPQEPSTVTGGMPFAGGPLNNFVFQALAKMVPILRQDPGSLGMVNAVSGLMTKQGVSLWSSEPRSEGFLYDDVSDATAAATESVKVDSQVPSKARIASYTVSYQEDTPHTAIVLCDRDETSRSLLSLVDPELALRLTLEEGCGREIRFLENGRAELD